MTLNLKVKFELKSLKTNTFVEKTVKMTTTAPDKLEDKWLVCAPLTFPFKNILHPFSQIRPCEMYDIEYKDCITIKARLHQHFIFGHSIDCNIWKRDYDNCDRWEKNQDERSAVSKKYCNVSIP